MTTQLALDILADLVAIPSIPGRSNETWLEYVKARLSAVGCRISVVPSPAGDCHGLIASLGPDVPGGIVLSGHVDVVSTEGQDWTGDPFGLRREGGKLFGRGTADVKGFVACAIAQIEEVARAPTEIPVHLCLSADEETTCQSAISLARHIKAHLPPVRGVLVGEPTRLAPANWQKHSYTCKIVVTGRAAHAGQPALGVSATALAARLIAWIDDRSGDPADPEATTFSIGTLHGGVASNTIAEHCDCEWDLRLSPDDTLDAILQAARAEGARLVAKNPGAGITITESARFPGFLTAPDSDFAQTCRAVSSNDFTQFQAGSEAGIFEAEGLPVIVMGPGDIAQAHIADEFIETGQIDQCCQQLRRLIERPT